MGDRLPFLSEDDDPLRRARRLRDALRDVVVHTSGRPCPNCGRTARLSGGEGCRCAIGGPALAVRCTDAAHRAPAAPTELVIRRCPGCELAIYPSMIVRREAS